MNFLFYNINGFSFSKLSDSVLQYFCKVEFSVFSCPFMNRTLMLMKQLAVLFWLFAAPTFNPLPGLVPMLSTSSLLAKLYFLANMQGRRKNKSLCREWRNTPHFQIESGITDDKKQRIRRIGEKRYKEENEYEKTTLTTFDI